MIGQLLDGRYRIIQALSTGGFGHTYVAEDTRIPGHPRCVVKHLKPSTNNPDILATAERLFWSEAESLAQLGNHDQIPRILDFLEENQEFFLMQEFVEGYPLTEELIPEEKLSESYAIDLLQGVLPVLEFIHQRDVIHRDIKPGNIIRRKQDGKLVLIDFGAVKQVRAFNTSIQDRQANATVSIGTPGYMSTEQGRGKPRPNSDIYALGMIAIQALTGMFPIDLDEDAETGEILWQKYTSVSPEFAAILTKMVRYHFKDRYQSATEVLKDLQKLAPTVQDTLATDTPVRELTLEWMEAGQKKTQVIRDRQVSKNPGTVRIGRDPVRCDVVFSAPGVVGLHAEIFFNPQQRVYLRNLSQTDPAVVDGQPFPTGEVALYLGSQIRLGQLELRVAAISLKQSSPSAKPTESIVQPPITPPQLVIPGIQPPPVAAVEPSPTPTPSVVLPSPRPVVSSSSSDSSKWLLTLGLGVVVVGGAIAGFTYLQPSPTITTTTYPTATGECEAVIAAKDNIRTEPTATNSTNVIQQYSQLPTEQKLSVTGKKAVVKDGNYWLQLKLPGGGLAYAHKSIIKNYSQLESCLKVLGKTFEPVDATSLITTPSGRSTPASTSPENEIQSKLTSNNSDINPTRSSTAQEPTNPPAQFQQRSSRANLPPDEGAEIFAQAKVKAIEGDLQGAIEIATEIKSNSALYATAKKAITKWQNELQQKSECMAKRGVWINGQCIAANSPQSTQKPIQQPTQQPPQHQKTEAGTRGRGGTEKENPSTLSPSP